MISLARKVIRFELNMWRSLYAWARRRVRGQGPGDLPVAYANGASAIMWAFIVLNCLEIVALHIMIPWETVRFLLDLLGVYSLVWFVGLLAAMKVHPHLVTGSGLRVRYGTSVDFTIPWESVVRAGTRIRSVEGFRTVRFDESVVSVGISSQTNVDIVLHEPMVVQGKPVTEVRIFADDPKALIAAVNSGRVAAVPGT
ncbi:MAG TPA: hypothetical protein VF062_27815 [Candidatus Limnocylindrales bacterium]